MLSCPAEGCKFTVRSDRALTVHVKKCKKARDGLTLTAEDIQQHEADYRKAKRRKISRLEAVPEVGEPMNVDLEVSSMKCRFESRCLIIVVILSEHQRTHTSNRRTSPLYRRACTFNESCWTYTPTTNKVPRHGDQFT